MHSLPATPSICRQLCGCANYRRKTIIFANTNKRLAAAKVPGNIADRLQPQAGATITSVLLHRGKAIVSSLSPDKQALLQQYSPCKPCEWLRAGQPYNSKGKLARCKMLESEHANEYLVPVTGLKSELTISR